MTVFVYRVYRETNEDENDIEDYNFSVIASDVGSEYFFGDKPNNGLDAERINLNVLRLYDENKKPETAEDWADVAFYRIRGTVYKLDKTFKSTEEARKAETEFAVEAKEMYQDMYGEEDE